MHSKLDLIWFDWIYDNINIQIKSRYYNTFLCNSYWNAILYLFSRIATNFNIDYTPLNQRKLKQL